MIEYKNEHCFYKWLETILKDNYYNYINFNNHFSAWKYEAERAFFDNKTFITVNSSLTKSGKDEIYYFGFWYDKKHNLIIDFEEVYK